jgi:hypothetical protein
LSFAQVELAGNRSLSPRGAEAGNGRKGPDGLSLARLDRLSLPARSRIWDALLNKMSLGRVG